MNDTATGFLARLKQRKLVQWAIAYVAFAFALIQVLDVVSDSYHWPDSAMHIVFGLLVLGFVVTVILAWYHGERGAQRISGPELLLIALALVIGGGLLWHFARSGSTAIVAKTVAAPAHSPGVSQQKPGSAVPNSAAAAAASGLRTVGAQAAPIPTKSVAVLPFENLSGDPNEKYFSDGITEEILNALAQIPNLKVAGRTSAFAFSGKNEDPRKIGEALGVANLLEGSVQKSGDEVRINVQLIDARTGYERWSEKYDRKLTSIFAIEDDISNAIAGKLRVQLTGGGGQALVVQKTIDPRAHDFYLRGLTLLAARGPGLKDAIEFFGKATSRAPDYAAAWAGLSQAHELLPWYNLGDWQESLVKAERAARHALALNPQLGNAHAALANVLRDRLDFADAIRQYQQALVLDPESSEIRNQYAQLLGSMGRFDDAIKQERVAVKLDPRAPDPYYILGWSLVCIHRYDDAVVELAKAVDLAPGFTQARSTLAFANLHAGHYADARNAARAVALQLNEDPTNIEALMKAFADPALRPEALKRVKDVHRLGEFEFGGLAQAFWYCLLGAHDKAIGSLRQWAATAKSGETYIGIFALRMPAFDAIRNDPRFKAVLKKMGLPYKPPSTSTP